MLKTKCCKNARGTGICWYSPKYKQWIDVQFCQEHYVAFDEYCLTKSGPLGPASDLALELVKPDQSRVAKRAGAIR